MRTTLTLDNDVAVDLKQITRETGDSFRVVVNEVLRLGLQARYRREDRPRSVDHIPVFDCGEALLPSLDKTHEVLSVGEGEEYR